MKHVDGSLTARLLAALCTVSIASLAAPAWATGNFTFEKALLRGEPAPGTEPGTVFAPLNGLCFDPVPRIDDGGHIACVATLQGPAVTTANRTGHWTGDPGAMSLLVRAGAQAPGVPPGGVFASFPFDFALSSPTGGSGRLGFTAMLTGAGITEQNNEGIWVSTSGVTSLLVREGSAAPGPAGLTFTTPVFIEVNRAGHGLVTGTVNGAGVSTTNNEAFWTDRSGALALLLREGDPAPVGDPGVVIGGAGEFIGTGYTFLDVTWNEDSKLAVVTSLTGPGITTFNNEILLVERAAGHTILAREGEHAPGFPPNVTFGGGSIMADFGMVATNRLGHTAFTARVSGTNTPTEYPIFSDHTGALGPFVRSFDPAPGTNKQFGIVAGPVLSDGGRLAFRASFSDGGQWPPLGIWWDQPGALGEILPLAIPGDPVPGRPGVTIVGVTFIHAFNAEGKLAFEAALEANGSPAGTALFLARPTGEIDVVVVTGDLIDAQGHPGDGIDMRAVSNIEFGGMNASGEMAIRLDFGDGAFGFYVVTGAATSVADATPTAAVRLARNVPNPFGSATRLEFDLAAPSRVAVSVFDASGRLVNRLLDEPRLAGRQTLSWDGRDRSGTPASSGVYWARIETAGASNAVRMVLVR